MSYSLRASVGMATSSTTSVAPASLPSGWQAQDLLVAVTMTNATGTPTPTDPSGWTRLITTSSAAALMLYGRWAQSGDTVPTFTWSSGVTAADIAAFSGGPVTDLATINDKYTERASTSTSVVVFNGGSLAPTNDNSLVIMAGRMRKTGTSDGATFGSAPSTFTKFTNGFANPNGGTQDVIWCYCIQTTKATIATNQTLSMSIAEGAGQNTQGFGVVLKLGSPIVLPSRSLLGVGT